MASREASLHPNAESRGADVVRLLRVLGNEDRLRIVCNILSSHAGELNVTELSVLNGLKQSALSQHLAKMRDCGVVEVRRNGHYKFYRINDPDNLWKLLTALCGYLRVH
jgi:ArsR family transcriptional regulator